MYATEKMAKVELEDGIFELRTHLSDKIARTLYYYQVGQRIIITHGFIKKTPKTPKVEINRAKKLRQLYNERLKHDKL